MAFKGDGLLTRTHRSVATEPASILFRRLSPHLLEIEQELTALRDTRDHPPGIFALTPGNTPCIRLLWPVLKPFMAQYPDINVEVTVDNGLTDIVDGRFDAGCVWVSRWRKI